MSLYGDAIRALRQVILLDERMRTTALDVERLSAEIADLRDRLSRLEGMLAGNVAGFAAAARPRRRRLPNPHDEGS